MMRCPVFVCMLLQHELFLPTGVAEEVLPCASVNNPALGTTQLF
jgi:hypothetical protein